MTTDPSNGRLPYGNVSQHPRRKRYLDTEEARACRKYNAKNGWTAQAVHNQQWAQQQNTCRRVTRASQRLTVQGQPRVDDRQNYAD
jgi:hypothetical protein